MLGMGIHSGCKVDVLTAGRKGGVCPLPGPRRIFASDRSLVVLNGGRSMSHFVGWKTKVLMALSGVYGDFLSRIILESISFDVGRGREVNLLNMGNTNGDALLGVVAKVLPFSDNAEAIGDSLRVKCLGRGRTLGSRGALERRVRSTLSRICSMERGLLRTSGQVSTSAPNSRRCEGLSRTCRGLAGRCSTLSNCATSAEVGVILGKLKFNSFGLRRGATRLDNNRGVQFNVTGVLLRGPRLLVLSRPAGRLSFAVLA